MTTEELLDDVEKNLMLMVPPKTRTSTAPRDVVERVALNPYTPDMPGHKIVPDIQEVPSEENPASRQIIEHVDGVCTKVHDHAIEVLNSLAARIDDLKTKVAQKREQMALYTSEYVGLADKALKAADQIGLAVERLEKHLDQ